ncbi:MAG: dTDP-4-dehydrorhamnose reductase [Nitrososphaerales archaeon]
MRVAVLGASGQLGTDLVKVLRQSYEVIGLTHDDVEVSDKGSLDAFSKYSPDVVINTAAFHKTDACEDEPLKTFAVNALGARYVAEECLKCGATVCYISTDYVFDGLKGEPYSEDDAPNPINTYGVSKLAGEFYTKMNPRHYIFRVASLFGSAGSSGKGGNFVETVVGKAKRGEELSVVDDMWMSPTYTRDAAEAIKIILEQRLPYGIYHVVNDGYCSWFEFAKEALNLIGAGVDVKPIKSSQLQVKARRPRFSALKSVKLPFKMRGWREALRAYLAEKGHLKG